MTVNMVLQRGGARFLKAESLSVKKSKRRGVDRRRETQRIRKINHSPFTGVGNVLLAMMRILVDSRRCLQERLALAPTRRRNTAAGSSTARSPLGALSARSGLNKN